MALIRCSECSTEVSDRAATCPKCGAPHPRRTAPRESYRAHYWVIGIFAVFMAGVLILISVGPEYESQADQEYAMCKEFVKQRVFPIGTNCLEVRERAAARLKREAEMRGK